MPNLPRLDTSWCLKATHWCERRAVRSLFALVSRLGDGAAWYALMAMMIVVDGRGGCSPPRIWR